MVTCLTVTIFHLPTFPKSNAWDFRSIYDNFRTLPKMFRRLLNIAEDSRRCSDDFLRLLNVAVRSSKCRRDLVSLLFRTETRRLAPFAGLFWAEIEFSFSRLWLMNKKSGIVSQACQIVLHACGGCFGSASVWHTHNACELAGIQRQYQQEFYILACRYYLFLGTICIYMTLCCDLCIKSDCVFKGAVSKTILNLLWSKLCYIFTYLQIILKHQKKEINQFLKATNHKQITKIFNINAAGLDEQFVTIL